MSRASRTATAGNPRHYLTLLDMKLSGRELSNSQVEVLVGLLAPRQPKKVVDKLRDNLTDLPQARVRSNYYAALEHVVFMPHVVLQDVGYPALKRDLVIALTQ